MELKFVKMSGRKIVTCIASLMMSKTGDLFVFISEIEIVKVNEGTRGSPLVNEKGSEDISRKLCKVSFLRPLFTDESPSSLSLHVDVQTH